MWEKLPNLRRINEPETVKNYIRIQIDRLFWKFWSIKESYSAEPFTEKEWDYLFLMDSARFDLFKEANEIDGDLKKVETLGSDTELFFKRNFSGQEFDDIIYVTANMIPSKLYEGEFAIFREPWKELEEGETRLPAERMAKHCIDAIETYGGDYRYIFHFLHPHLAIKDTEGLNQNTSDSPDISSAEKYFQGWISKRFPPGAGWRLMTEGKIEEEKIWGIQEKLLEEGLTAVEKVLNHCDGKAVISADHGNAYGEEYVGKKVVEHPKFIRHPSIVEVPWLKVDESELEQNI